MSMVKKSISVTDQQDAWIQAQMATGDYASDSEVIRSAIRAKQQQSEEIEHIRAALKAGRKSGITDMSAQDILREIKEELRCEGAL